MIVSIVVISFVADWLLSLFRPTCADQPNLFSSRFHSLVMVIIMMVKIMMMMIMMTKVMTIKMTMGIMTKHDV